MLSHFSRVRLCVTPETTAHQAPPSLGFSRQEHWSRLPFPSPGDLPDPGIEPTSPALTGWFFTAEPPGRPCWRFSYTLTWNLWETLKWDFLVGFFSMHLLGGFPIIPSNYKTAPFNSFLRREAAAGDIVGCIVPGPSGYTRDRPLLPRHHPPTGNLCLDSVLSGQEHLKPAPNSQALPPQPFLLSQMAGQHLGLKAIFCPVLPFYFSTMNHLHV